MLCNLRNLLRRSIVHTILRRMTWRAGFSRRTRNALLPLRSCLSPRTSISLFSLRTSVSLFSLYTTFAFWPSRSNRASRALRSIKQAIVCIIPDALSDCGYFGNCW